MGCVSSNLLNENAELCGFTLSQHVAMLTSSTYALLTLDSLSSPPPSAADDVVSPPASLMTPPQMLTISGKDPMPVKSEPREVFNLLELRSGLEACGFLDPNLENPGSASPPEENRVVIYTTSLRGVRRTFEACNAVRAALESFGVVICERDVSMDRGFREELSRLLRNPEEEGEGKAILPPRVFVKGEYIGGAEEVMLLAEEGVLGDLLRGVPRKEGCCQGCGDLSFLPCAGCNGSCKFVHGWGSEAVVVRCTDCNENGLVRCPICSY